MISVQRVGDAFSATFSNVSAPEFASCVLLRLSLVADNIKYYLRLTALDHEMVLSGCGGVDPSKVVVVDGVKGEG